MERIKEIEASFPMVKASSHLTAPWKREFTSESAEFLIKAIKVWRENYVRHLRTICTFEKAEIEIDDEFEQAMAE